MELPWTELRKSAGGWGCSGGMQGRESPESAPMKNHTASSLVESSVEHELNSVERLQLK